MLIWDSQSSGCESHSFQAEGSVTSGEEDEWDAQELAAWDDHQLLDRYDLRALEDEARERQVPAWTDAELRAEADRLRRRYFPTLTASYTVRHVVFPRQSDAGYVLGRWREGSREMLIDLARPEHAEWSVVQATILHELCHVAVGPDREPHGPRFIAEVQRVISLGGRVALNRDLARIVNEE